MKFKEYKGLDLAATADDVLKQWDAHDTFMVFLRFVYLL